MRRAELLAGRTLGSPGGDFVIAEWVDEGGGFEPPSLIAPLHVHHSDDEAWYLLEGTLAFRVSEEEVQAEAGAAVQVPRGVKHAYWNPRPEPARYLLVMTARIAGLIDAIHAAADRDPETLRRLFREFDSELLA